MTELQKEFESTGYASWINSNLYPDGKIYSQEYTQWLERQVLALRQPLVSGSLHKADGFKYMCSECGKGYDCVECGCSRCNDVKVCNALSDCY